MAASPRPITGKRPTLVPSGDALIGESFIGITIKPTASRPVPVQMALLLPLFVWGACCPNACDANNTQHKATTMVFMGSNNTYHCAMKLLLILGLLVVFVLLWWYYRPTIEWAWN